jgi:hypothetical protein
MSDSDIPSEKDEHLMGTNGKPDLRTICGYCTQGRHVNVAKILAIVPKIIMNLFN